MSKEMHFPKIPRPDQEGSAPGEMPLVFEEVTKLNIMFASSDPLKDDPLKYLDENAYLAVRAQPGASTIHYKVDFPKRAEYGKRFADLLNQAVPKRTDMLFMSQDIGEIMSHWKIISAPVYQHVKKGHEKFGEYWEEPMGHLQAFAAALKHPSPEHLLTVAKKAVSTRNELIIDFGVAFEPKVMPLGASSFSVSIGDASFLFSKENGEFIEKKRRVPEDPPVALRPRVEWVISNGRRYFVSGDNADNFAGLIILSYLSPEVNNKMRPHGHLPGGNVSIQILPHAVPATVSLYRQALINGSACRNIEKYAASNQEEI